MHKENKKFNKIRTICCVGAGYVGGPSMAVIADRCPEIDVFVVDSNLERLNAWNNEDLRKLPIYEPGLDEIISRTRNRNLFFSNAINKSIEKADMVFISVNTPIKSNGIGAGQTSNLKWVESCARIIKEIAIGHTIVVEKSTLPVRTAQSIKEILNSSDKKVGKSFSILSNPEFLAEGTAVENLENPDRVLIGGEDQEAINYLISIYENWIPKEKILTTNLWSSELSKLTANAFLAQRISSINSISALCERTGASVSEVSKAVGLDKRIGREFLNAGPGFGGSCFKKDILNLVYICNYYGLGEVADYWEQVIKINQWQQKRIYKIIVDKLFGNLAGKKIAILGFAFKANTNDTRESPSIQLSKDLLLEDAILNIHDPKVSSLQIEDALGIEPKTTEKNLYNWSKFSNLEEAIVGVDAIIILTDWQEYKDLDWMKISSTMRKPSWIFDTRSILEINQINNLQSNYWKLGDGFL